VRSKYTGICDRCKNPDQVRYPRRRLLFCAHCCDLDDGSSGRIQFRDGYARAGNPRSQPARIGEERSRKAPCVHCGVPATCISSWPYGPPVRACGWGHAGLWMDQILDAEQLDWKYLYDSLGMEPPPHD
jgi:hypothetical protein